MWGNLRDWLKAGGALPPELRSDLTGLEYGYSAKGEIQLERKEDVKRRGLASPGIGDALALTFAQPVAARWLYHQPGEVRFIGEGTRITTPSTMRWPLTVVPSGAKRSRGTSHVFRDRGPLA